jgi:inorganic pyrophosphatase
MDYYEIVRKLIGNIEPVGETNEDDRRFENLKKITELTEKLIAEIANVESDYKSAYQYSMKRVSNYAGEFLNRLGIKE